MAITLLAAFSGVVVWAQQKQWEIIWVFMGFVWSFYGVV
jgi:hypothetical protein